MAQAYGSITLVDVSDLGQLSVVPESNQPLTVIYNPDNNSYFPNWGNENLILTPVIYYGGKELKYGDNGVTIDWKQKVNSGNETESITNGTVSDGKLVINGNPFSNNSTIYTYIVTVNYVDSSYGIDLQAKGQISFSLIKHASKIKDIKITGESVFLYKGDGSLQSNSSIILTATANGTSIQKWQYKDSNGNWVDISDQTSQTLTINAEDGYFVNDLANIRVLAGDLIENTTENLYDEHSIIKIRQGANGTSTVSAILSNDDQMLPADKDGIVSNYSDAQSKITIYSGSTDITSEYNITFQPSDSKIVYELLDDFTCKITYFPTELEVGYITFNCTPKDTTKYKEIITKKFSLTKIKTGADGISPEFFSLSVNSLAINKSTEGAYTPSELIATAYKHKGQDKTEYAGRFKIYLDDSEEPLETSANNQVSYSYQIANVNKNIKIELYEAGGFNKLLDTQTVIITSDGIQGPGGEDGEPGVDALNFVLGNYSDLIPCNSNGTVAVDTEIKIPFSAYKGITKVACTASVNNLPTGVSSNVSNATTTVDGSITLTFAKNSNLGIEGEKTGTINITLTALGQTSSKTYTWTKNLKATDGANSVILQAFAPQGNIISNNKNNVTLEATLVDGTTEVSTGITYKWYQYKAVDENKTTFDYIYFKDGKEITVQPSDIESYNSFKCEATYNDITYKAYISVYDKTDPLQVVVYSTLGDKLVNGVGKGIVYALVYRNGEEIDPMKTTNCGSSLPANGTLDNYFWLLDSEEQTANLYHYTGSAWTSTSNNSEDWTYTWNLVDHSSESSEPIIKNGKAIFVDSNVVNKKMTFNVKVEETLRG